MKVPVSIHVRPAAVGRVVITPLDFPGLAREGKDRDAAIAKLRPSLIKQIQRLRAIDRAALLAPSESELLRVPLDVPQGDSGEMISIMLGVVVTKRVARGSTVYLFRAPAVPAGLSRISKSREQGAELIAKAAAKAATDQWGPAVLALDEPEESHLETIEIEIADEPAEIPSTATPPVQTDAEEKESMLRKYGRELTGDSPGRLGRVDMREDLVTRVLGLLGSPGRSSVLLVGPPDVGKTALVHEIAARLASGEVPPSLRGRKLWRATANELMAGATYHGVWQARFGGLADELRESRAICFMGDPAAIIDAGRWSKSDNNASRHLRPALDTGEITIICEATTEQLTVSRMREPNFIDVFHLVEVPEPPIDVVREIATVAAKRIADASAIEVPADAIEAAMELTRKFEPYRGFPGKAIRLLEDTLNDLPDGAERIDRAELTRTFAKRSGLPAVLLLDDVRLDVPQVRERFTSRVLGQPQAISAMVDVVAVLKASMAAPGKPLGSFLFVGPTGVGKTELARALAEFLFGNRDRVLRLDMGEYASSDALVKLVGSGWREDADGELTRRIREQPFSVILLDEIEKAHPTVFDALLSLLGDGRLTSAAGRTASFENAIVIMTSNLGALRGRAPSLGFAVSGGDERERVERHYRDQAERFFRPEFLNRIDRVVVFNALDEEVVRQIARRELGKLLLREGIVRRRLLVEVDDGVIEALASRGMDPQYGARPLQRVIERAVIAPLAHLVVERRPEPGSLARIAIKTGDISLELESVREAGPPRVGRSERRIAENERTFAKAITAASEFEGVLDAEETTAPVTALRGEISGLIVKTHDPSFWDDKMSARITLARIYQLEYVLERLDRLRDRANGLTQMARQANGARMRERVSEVWLALDEMADALAVVRLEIAGAVAGGGGRGAILTVLPVGDAEDWADELFAMYCSWADRTAREVTRLSDRHAARIEGLSSYDLLRGEAGLHRRIHSDRRVQLARVAISSVEKNGHSDEPTAYGAVIRVYEEGKRQLVRDPRTGTKETKVDAVLREGRIDAFLLAWLRLERERDSALAT